MFLLKAEAPDKYREKVQLLTPDVLTEQIAIMQAELQRRERERDASKHADAIEATSTDTTG